MRGLDLLLSRSSQLRVLRVLYRAQKPLNGRDVERLSGLSNLAAMQALDALVTLSAVQRDVTSRMHLYTLNRSHYFVARGLKPAFEAEEWFWTDFRKTVRKRVIPRPLAAVAAGPLARDEEAFSLRVQVILVFSSTRNRLRAYKSLDALAEAIDFQYAAQLDPLLLDAGQVHEPKYAPLWRRVEREGILLFGQLP